jgi:hypothetical protein
LKIHIRDTNFKPNAKLIITNCNKVLPFIPIKVFWSDGRICPTCLDEHRKNKTKYTFAVTEIGPQAQPKG